MPKMSIAQQVIGEEIARAMLASEIKSISGAAAFAALPPAARAFASELAERIEERIEHSGVPLAEIMEGLIFVATPETLDAQGFVRKGATA